MFIYPHANETLQAGRVNPPSLHMDKTHIWIPIINKEENKDFIVYEQKGLYRVLKSDKWFRIIPSPTNHYFVIPAGGYCFQGWNTNSEPSSLADAKYDCLTNYASKV